MSPKSIIGLTEHLKSLYKKVAEKLQGSDRRQFMAEVVKGLGIGGQTVAERELGSLTILHTTVNITRSNVVLVG